MSASVKTRQSHVTVIANSHRPTRLDRQVMSRQHRRNHPIGPVARVLSNFGEPGDQLLWLSFFSWGITSEVFQLLINSNGKLLDLRGDRCRNNEKSVNTTAVREGIDIQPTCSPVQLLAVVARRRSLDVWLMGYSQTDRRTDTERHADHSGAYSYRLWRKMRMNSRVLCKNGTGSDAVRQEGLCR